MFDRPLPCRLASTLLLTLAVFSSACEEPDDSETLEIVVEDVVSELNAQTEVACDCWQQLGFATQMACTDNEILPAQRRCIEDALGRDAAQSLERLDCMLPLEAEYTACVDQRLACEDLTTADPCAKDYQLGLQQCPALPGSVQRGYDACFE
jgi:hypothetical protein